MLRYHVKFGSSSSKGVCINRTEPPNWGALGPAPCCRGVADALEIRPSPMYYPAEFCRSTSNSIPALLRRSAWKFESSRPAFQGHSRSSEPTGIDPPYDLLTFHVNHGPISYRFRDKWRSQIFPTPCILRSHWRGSRSPWGIPALGFKKLEW